MVHAGEDDLGQGGDAGSLASGNAGARLGCGIIKEVGKDLVVFALDNEAVNRDVSEAWLLDHFSRDTLTTDSNQEMTMLSGRTRTLTRDADGNLFVDFVKADFLGSRGSVSVVKIRPPSPPSPSPLAGNE